MNEYCFYANETNPFNSKEICDPTSSNTSFVEKPGKIKEENEAVVKKFYAE